MTPNLDTYITELESKIQILELENETLSAKAEENLLLNRAFEKITVDDDINKLLTNTLESISILLNIQFSGLFELIDKQFICKNSYALFSNEETIDIQIKVPEILVKKLISKKTCVINEMESGFDFIYPNSDFVAENAVIIPFNSEIIKNRFFVFINISHEQNIAERVPLFEKFIGIISAKLERIYYQNELKILNEELEKKIDLRTQELQKRNSELKTERIRAEKNEALLRNLVEVIPDGIYKSTEGGVFVEVNPAMVDMLGYDSKEELMAIDIKTQLYFHVDDRESVVLQENLKETGIYRMRKKDGSEIWVEDHGWLTFDKKTNTFFHEGIMRDVTERKYAEEALLKSEAKYREIFENIQDAFYEVTLDGVVIEISPSFNILSKGQYTREDLIGKPLSEVYANYNDRDLFLKELQRKGNVNDYELDLKNKDGSIIPCSISSRIQFDVSGNPVKIIGSIRDITERKNAEKELKKLTTAVEQSANTIIITNAEGEIEYANPVFTELTGYTADQAKGQNPRFLNAGTQNKEYYAEMWKTILGGKIWKGEFHNKTKGGDLFWEQVTISPIKDKEGKTINFLAVKEDITAKRNAEQALKESEEKYRTMIETSNDLIWMLDGNGNFTFFNKQTEETTGYLIKDWMGKSFTPLIFEEELPFLQDVFVKGMNGKPTAYEFHLKIANGSILTFSVKTAPIVINEVVTGMVSFARDITQQKEAELKLLKALKNVEESETRFKALHNASFGGIAIHDKGLILDCNQGLAEMSGYTVKELIGMDGLLLIAEDLRELVMSNILAAYEKPYEAIGLQKNGKEYALRLEAKNIPYKGKEVRVVEFRDISEIKKAENNLKDALEKATESDRLKSAFLANMSHEIRTPMNGILGFAELLKQPDLTGEQQQEYIRIIEKGGARMLNIINDIVDISRIESKQVKISLSETNIIEQIEYIYTFFKPEVENKSIKFLVKNELQVQDALVITDREKLYAILTNLVKNAIKYTEKGSIEFGCKIIEMHGRASIQFYIEDTGIGIPIQRQEAIFERFIQADIEDKMARQGAGLGLAISKAYVEMLGGDMWLESLENKGSTFYFTIPYVPVKVEQMTVKGRVMEDFEESHINNLKILIVEDDETSAELISIVINNYGKEILVAQTGEEAVEACRLHPDIDLILMDIQLPVMNGYEATRQIREFNTEVVIIAQTAFALIGDKEKALDAGCDDYISKPINADELLKLVMNYF